jgi:hypothetical protein
VLQNLVDTDMIPDISAPRLEIGKVVNFIDTVAPRS